MFLESKARLESGLAKVQLAHANITEARNELARLKHVRELSRHTVPSQHSLDAAEAALARALAEEAGAQAAVAEARATLEVNETDLSKAVIRSPVDGIVLVRNAQPGQTLAASFQAPVLFTLAQDLTQMELHVDVDEADVGRVREGQDATFRVDAYPDHTFPARITQVRYGSKTVDGVVTYETVMDVDNAGLLLRPGMTATADIVVNRVQGALLAPNAALRFTPPSAEKDAPKERGSLISRLLPHPPRWKTRPETGPDAAVDSKAKRVWTLQEGGIVPLAVTTGATDGRMTEIKAGDVQPGTVLVVDTARPEP
jgi:HlyD family secretion protein